MQVYEVENKMIKKIFICLLLLSSVACQEKKNDDVLKIAISPDYPPFEYKRDGKIVGFDVDMALIIAKELGKKLEITELEFSSLIPALQSGKVDFVASGLTVTKERKANIDFSDVYYQASIVGIAFPTKNIHNMDDLKGKRIGAQLGSVMEIFAKDTKEKFTDITIASLTNNLHLLQELKLGRIDILLIEEGQVQGFLKNNPDLISVTFPKTGSGYAIGFRKNSTLKEQFNKVLAKLKADGTLAKQEKLWIEKE
jgi:ABC-type amino acid transport substrate-binding protein